MPRVFQCNPARTSTEDFYLRSIVAQFLCRWSRSERVLFLCALQGVFNDGKALLTSAYMCLCCYSFFRSRHNIAFQYPQ